MKKIALMLVAVILLNLGITAGASDEMINVAAGKKVMASGSTDGLPFAYTNLTDGNHHWGWSSSGDDEGVWATIDLGKSYKISRVNVVTRQDLDQPDTRQNLIVELSDDPEFGESVVIGDSGDNGLDFREIWKLKVSENDFYRYVKVRKEGFGYTFLEEIEVLVSNKDIDAVEKGDISYNDIEDPGLTVVVDLLTYLGICTPDKEQKLNPYDAVTRSEFLKFALMAVGVDSYSDDECFFEDMKNHPDSDAVEAARQMKIISDDEKYFRPDDTVTLNEALTIAVRALGYEELAEFQGGYPSGYYDVAKKLKLTKGIAQDKKQLNKINALYIAFNMLHSVRADYYFGENGKKDSQVITEIFGIDYDEGVCVANEHICIKGDCSKTGKDEITVNGVCYKVLQDKYKNFVGNKIRYYYKKDTDEIVSLSKTEEQKELTLKADDIDFLEDKTYFYTDENKSRKITLGQNTAIVYNGRPATYLSVPKNGTIRFIDSDGDDKFDVCFINDYRTGIIRVNDSAQKKLYIEFEKENMVIDYDDKKIEGIKNGKKSSVRNFKKDMVVSAILSSDGEYMKLIAGGESDRGTITKVNGEKVVIDYLYEYDINSDFIGKNELYLGNKGILYTDYENKAVTFVPDDKCRYGYLIRYAVDEEADDSLKIKIITEAGEEKTYTIRKKVKIDDVLYSEKEVKDKFDTLFKEGGQIKEQIIRYLSDVNFKISEIYTKSGGSVKAVDIDNQWYKNGIINGSYILGDETRVFTVRTKSDGRKIYKVTDKSYFREGTQIKCICYDADGLEGVGAVEVTGSKSDAIKPATPVMMIENVEECLVDEEDAILIKGYEQTTPCEYYITDKDDAGDIIKFLKRGNLVRVAHDENNEVIAAELVMDYNNEAEGDVLAKGIKRKDGASAGGEIWASFNCFYAYGHLIEEKDGFYSVNVDYYPDGLIANLGGKSVVTYDISKNRIEKIPSSQLITEKQSKEAASEVLLIYREGTLIGIYGYRE